MDFIQLLKDKAFKRYSLHVVRDKDTNQYKLVPYNEGIDEDFFRDLAIDLSLPINMKTFNFGFIRNDFKGFKNASVQSVIKQNISMEEFDNLFHSFYKNIPLNDLMNALYIKSDYMGNPTKNSIYQPYILYLLKQDFTHQNLYPDDFLNNLHFNFYITDNNYPQLKESLYTFLSTNISIVKNKFTQTYTNSSYADSQIKKFENNLYNKISKFIKPNDMKVFNEFWPHILITSNNNNMVTTVPNTFVFDLSHSYLSDTYSQVTNEAIAHKTTDFISDTINNNLSDYMQASIIVQNATHSRFVIEFKQSLTKQHIPDIFDSIIDIKIKTNQFK
ncbi:MAG: hypothetical protein K2P52_00675, partial [Campylobacterales bacterium]|nr:hypothetical protein [Campylobacterales bacterium]